MTLKELKDWVNSLPETFSEYKIVNGEEGSIPADDENNEPQYFYRIDKPVITLMVSEESQEILILNQTNEPVIK